MVLYSYYSTIIGMLLIKLLLAAHRPTKQILLLTAAREMCPWMIPLSPPVRGGI